MSWSVSAIGATVEEVRASLVTQFDAQNAAYPTGTLEGDDVNAARARVFAALDALDVQPGKRVSASAYGSHSWSSDKERPQSVSASFQVSQP